MLDLGGVAVEHDRPTRMRDGTILRADVYRPQRPGSYPVLLQRTPYNKRSAQTGAYQHPAWYARHDYVVVVQDVRGRFASDGSFEPYRHEATDGADTVKWTSELEGTTGRVGTFGFSYAGINQLLAAAQAPPGLVCAAPGCTGNDLFDGWTYRGGALQLAFVISWTLQALAGPDAAKRGDRQAFERVRALAVNMKAAYQRPLADWIRSGELPTYFTDWIEHDTRDALWEGLSPSTTLAAIPIPCLHIGGWYDVFRQTLVIGPWQHVPWAQMNGAMEYGPEAKNRVDELQLAWFDHWLRGTPLRRHFTAIRYFLMGANLWAEAETWPPLGARSCQLFLRSSGRAASLSGDGHLSIQAPIDEPPDIFVYDPSDPVPSLGGASCCRADTAPVGAFDQRAVEVRNDVLVYTSAPLRTDCDVVGPVELVLHAATDGPDTDWTAKLVDVHPDGRAMNLCDGIVRARYRESLDAPKPLTPGAVYKYRISLAATANRFGCGHCLRPEVSSSNFPTYDVNGNTGDRGRDFDPCAVRVATQVVLHDSRHASHLRLVLAQGSELST